MAGLSMMDYKNMGFDSEQCDQIEMGIQSGVDVSVYANKNLSALQMQEIREGLEQGLEAQLFAFEEYSVKDMIGIKQGLLHKEDRNSWPYWTSYSAVKTYYIAKQRGYNMCRDMWIYVEDERDMEIFLQCFEAGIDPLLGRSYTSMDLETARQCRKLGIDVNKFNNYQMTEIVEGYESHLPFEVYANEKFSAGIMKDIRILLEKKKWREILLVVHAADKMPAFVDASYDFGEPKVKKRDACLNALYYLLTHDEKLLEEVIANDVRKADTIVTMMRKGVDFRELLKADISSFDLDMIIQGCDVGLNLFPYIKRGWKYAYLMNLIIMSKMGIDAEEFINTVERYISEEVSHEDSEQQDADYSSEEELIDGYMPPLPLYFIMSELPKEFAPYEEFEFTEQSIYELMTTVEIKECCELFYDDPKNPSINNWRDFWWPQMGYDDLARLAHAGINFKGRVYKGMSSDGRGILYCFIRDLDSRDYEIFFREVK